MIAVDQVARLRIEMLRDQPVRLPGQRVSRKAGQEARWEEGPANLLDTVDAELA